MAGRQIATRVFGVSMHKFIRAPMKRSGSLTIVRGGKPHCTERTLS